MPRIHRPYLVYCDDNGEIFDDPRYGACGRSGYGDAPLDPAELIPLPAGSDIFRLPGRHPVATEADGKRIVLRDRWAAAAFIAPAHTQLRMAAYEREPDAPVLPLYAYTAVCWYKGGIHVPAVRIDPDIRQEPEGYDHDKVKRGARAILKRFPANRLVRHVIENCALTYFCPAARNFALGRWEAPLPTSPSCNARCTGCISLQDATNSPVSCTQPRLSFTPTPEEVAELALFHIGRADRPVVSFGQGCEGEPLLVADVIEAAIRLIRSKTASGTINLNTNASKPGSLKKLFSAGLDSVRISMNSTMEDRYLGYYNPVGYGFGDVMESFKVARAAGAWISINYFVFPGMTDRTDEFEALRTIVRTYRPDMIQWRNFNIDPDWYLESLPPAEAPAAGKALGVSAIMARLKTEFPFLRYGYFNPFLGSR